MNIEIICKLKKSKFGKGSFRVKKLFKDVEKLEVVRDGKNKFYMSYQEEKER